MSEDVILELVRSRAGRYTLTPDALISLKQAGVPDKVIAALISRSEEISPETSQSKMPTSLEAHEDHQLKGYSKDPQVMESEDETPIKLRSLQTVTSGEPIPDGYLSFKVSEDVRVNTILIPRGTKAIGRVVECRPSRVMGKGGMLTIQLIGIRLPGVGTIALRTPQNGSDRRLLGESEATVSITARSNWLVVPLIMIHGKEASLLKGTVITVYTDGSVMPESAPVAKADQVGIEAAGDFFRLRPRQRTESSNPSQK